MFLFSLSKRLISIKLSENVILVCDVMQICRSAVLQSYHFHLTLWWMLSGFPVSYLGWTRPPRKLEIFGTGNAWRLLTLAWKCQSVCPGKSENYLLRWLKCLKYILQQFEHRYGFYAWFSFHLLCKGMCHMFARLSRPRVDYIPY